MAGQTQKFNGDGPITIVHGSTENIYSSVNINHNVIPKLDSINFNMKSPEINFVGRLLELTSLEKVMQTSPNSDRDKPLIAVVSGLGGIGKTQLVRKFAQNNRSAYNHTIWINSEKKESINESFKRLASDVLNIPITNADGQEKDINSIIESVINKLSKFKTLFVYDNVEKIENIEFLLTVEPSNGKPSVIITSRIREWDAIDVIQIKAWQFDDAIEYVSKTLNRSDDSDDSDEDKKMLVEKLQYFPLALRQATAYINYQRIDQNFRIAEYADNYDTQEMLDSTLFRKSSYNIYEKTTFTTWSVTIDAIEKTGASGMLAIKILQIIAYFDPDNILREILFHLQPETESVKRVKIDYTPQIRKAVRLLINYSMIDGQNQQSILSIHRLVQLVVKLKLEETHQDKSILRDALLLVSKVLQLEHFKFYTSHSHFISVFLSALKFNDIVREFKSLPMRILSSLIESGKYNQTKAFGHKILQPLTNILGDDDRDMLLTRFYITRSYIKQGMHTDALKMNEELFEKQKNILGDNHPHTLATSSNIAYSYRELGKHVQALQMYQDILEKQKKIVGEDHQDTLPTRSNIAYSYMELGKYTEALKMYQQILKKQIDILGKNHPNTFITRSNIAQTYIELGNFTEALKIFEEVFQQQKTSLEEDHPDILITRSNIAFSKRELGHVDEAFQIYQEVLEKQKNILGEDHPHTLATKCNIGNTYSKLKKQTEALAVNLEVFEKQKYLLGEYNRDTLTTRSNIGHAYKELGNFPEALNIFQEVFEKQKSFLGEDHPQTLTTKFNLAELCAKQGKYTDAEHIYIEVLEKRQRIIGKDHPDTLVTICNLAYTKNKLGDSTEALHMLQEIFEKQKAILGDTHPHTVVTGINIAELCGVSKRNYEKQNMVK